MIKSLKKMNFVILCITILALSICIASSKMYLLLDNYAIAQDSNSKIEENSASDNLEAADNSAKPTEDLSKQENQNILESKQTNKENDVQNNSSKIAGIEETNHKFYSKVNQNRKPFYMQIPNNKKTSSDTERNVILYYNAYEDGKVPSSLRNQTVYNMGWSFANMAALESSLISQGLADQNIDLSERQHAYFYFNTMGISDLLNLITNSGQKLDTPLEPVPEEGPAISYLDATNELMFSALDLMKWNGPIVEQDAPYSQIGDYKKESLDNVAYIQYLRNLGPEEFQKHGFNTWQEINTKFLSLLANFNLDDNLAYKDAAAHVQNVDFIPFTVMTEDYQVVQDIEQIKNAIHKNGAVAAAYYESNNNNDYNIENNCYYTNETGTYNHCVALVGWNDQFDKNNFNTKPEKDGAFLVRNSFGGDDEGQNPYNKNGYFWISYCDSNFNNPQLNAVAVTAENVNNFNNNYQYDGSSFPTSAVLDPDGGAISNVYTAKANKDGVEELNAVSVGTFSPNMSFKLQVYTNIKDTSNPTSGTPCYSNEERPVVNIENAGYHTFKLEKPIYLKEGDNYSIVLENADTTGQFLSVLTAATTPMPGWQNFVQETKAGQSFRYTKDLTTGEWQWVDLANDPYTPSVNRIKAYTNNKCELKYTGDYEDTVYTNVGETATLPICPDEGYVFTYYIGEQQISGPVYTVNTNTTINIVKKKIKFNIVYKLNGGTNSDKNLPYILEDETREEISLSNPVKENNLFLGWVDITDGNDSNLKIDSFNTDRNTDLCLEAVFSPCDGHTLTIVPMKKLDESDVLIKASAVLGPNLLGKDNFELSYNAIEKDSDKWNEMISKFNMTSDIWNMFDVNLKLNIEFIHNDFGTINLELGMGDQFNQINYNVHHLHFDNQQSTTQSIVNDGVLKTSTTDLSTFAIEKYVEPVTPVTPDNPSNISENYSAQTFDHFNIVFIIFTILAMTSIVYMGYRQIKKK